MRLIVGHGASLASELGVDELMISTPPPLLADRTHSFGLIVQHVALLDDTPFSSRIRPITRDDNAPDDRRIAAADGCHQVPAQSESQNCHNNEQSKLGVVDLPDSEGH